jgi:glucose/arabinose dehydrogenase
VAETNAPKRPEDGKGLKGWIFGRYQKKAGGAAPSADRITLLRDGDGDGFAELRTVFLSGLHSPFGMALVGDALYVANTDAIVRSGTLWTSVNERDELGPDLVPDYMTSVKEDGFYGWPYSYFGMHVDGRVKPQRPDLVAKALVPDYALGPHTASLGLAYVGEDGVSPLLSRGMFVGQHGSWNRNPFSGNKVIFVPFERGRPSSAPPIDVLTGFLQDDAALGRPVGVAIDRRNGLLVADDVGNTVWRVSSKHAGS